MINGEITSRVGFCVGISVSALVVATAAKAEQPAIGDHPAVSVGTARTTVYDGDFFARFGPSTALDIANHVPGFILETGNRDVRGFAGAAGNVVINGARPSSKAEALDALLARIPARRVQRVEVGPGDLFGSDYSGKSQVLNIVLTPEGGLDGSVTAKVARLFTGRIVPNLEATALIRHGASSVNLSAGTGRADSVEEGFDRLTSAGDGSLVEFRRKVNNIRQHDPFVAASWGLERGPDKAIHLNLRFQPSSFFLGQANHVLPAAGPERRDRLIEDYKLPAFELGADVSRPLGGGAIKLVGLATRRKRDTYDASFNRIEDATVGGFEQFANSRYDETLGRLSWSRGDFKHFSVEAGSEIALNKLDYSTSLFLLDGSGGRSRVDLPLSNAVVKEIRTESYVNAGRQLSKFIRVDGRLAYETSKLTVSGDTQARRSLSFLKPSLTVDLQPGGGWHGQLIVRRTVAQLDFYDFVSSADLAAGRVNGGNADLQPQRSWEARAIAEHALLGDGKVRLEIGYDRISMLQDRVLTADGVDAPGNIGAAQRSFAELTLDVPLTRLWSGLRLKTDTTLQRTRVIDPITGKPRRFSGFWPDWSWNAELRRDKGRWSYGATAGDNQMITFFRTDELDSNRNDKPYVTAFAEFRQGARTLFRLDVDNAIETSGQRIRNFYFPNRTSPLPSLDEFRDRNTHIRLTFSLRRSLGGGGVAKAVAAR